MDENKTCKTCKHFIQHYIKFKKRYEEITRGHCVFPRIKNRESTPKACEHYKEKG